MHKFLVVVFLSGSVFINWFSSGKRSLCLSGKKNKKEKICDNFKLQFAKNIFVKLWKKRSDLRQRKTMTRKADAQAVGRRQRCVPNWLGCHYVVINAMIMLECLRVHNPLDDQVSLYWFGFIEIHYNFF